MINTQLADSSVLVLAVIMAWFLAGSFYRQRRTGIKKMPLLFISFMGMWCVLNMVAHLVAVMWVNTDRMLKGTFSYTFYFYGLLLMGVVFLVLSVLQLYCVSKISRGDYTYRSRLTVYCLGLSLLSLPLVPINPLGLLPVITSLSILATLTVTRKQWHSSKLQQTFRPKTAISA